MNPVWARSFERRVAREDNARMNVLIGQKVQQSCDCEHVLAVLMYGVLEFVVLLVENLGPLRGPRISEQPSSVVLRLEHEDAISRDQDVIDLGRAVVHR